MVHFEMILYSWFFLLFFVQTEFHEADGYGKLKLCHHCTLIIDSSFSSQNVPVDERFKMKLPLHSGESQPPPIFVHIWISRVDTGEHSCIGVRKQGGRILVPEWCVTVGGEKRGRIAIYAPKPAGRVTSFSRACPYQRYDEQFDFLYENDDLRQILADSKLQFGLNTVVLEIPGLSHDYVTCFWGGGDTFSHMESISMLISWKRGHNGEFFFVQKLIDKSIKQKQSFEALREEDGEAQAVVSVCHDTTYLIFEGFFKDPPKYPGKE